MNEFVEALKAWGGPTAVIAVIPAAAWLSRLDARMQFVEKQQGGTKDEFDKIFRLLGELRDRLSRIEGRLTSSNRT